VTEVLAVKDLLAAVGEVMLRWGFLETAMLTRLGGESPARPIVQAWQSRCNPDHRMVEEIAAVASVRHALAHGLFRVEARPAVGSPHVSCRLLDQSAVEFTFDQLREAAERLDRLRLRIEAGSRTA
jgi:hypothetical protein